MQLFYQPDISETSKDVVFTREESKHISRVLRKKEGDLLNITNGNGDLFEVELAFNDPKKCQAIILNSKKLEPLPYHLHMAVAPTKINDRFEWFLEKATEIGIHKITPIICDHSERKAIKPERYEKIIESAMKQSLKAYKPILAPQVSFSEFMKQSKGINATKCIAHCQESVKVSLNSMVQPEEDIVMLIGPEGDFSYKEIELAVANSFNEISLGGSRLRTETAAIVACTHVSLCNMK